jgi:hypothetical protein
LDHDIITANTGILLATSGKQAVIEEDVSEFKLAALPFLAGIDGH